MKTATPAVRPANACFSSGPCAKRRGWSPEVLADATLGRSHRAKGGKSKLKLAIDLTREVFGVPERLPHRHHAGIRHRRGGNGALVSSRRARRRRGGLGKLRRGLGADVVKELKLKDARTLKAAVWRIARSRTGRISTATSSSRWNGTTSGVRVPDADWIPADRKGLTICDATSAAFAQDLDWAKLDVDDLLVAEGARRRGGARHDRPQPSRRRTASRPIRPPGRCRRSSV